MPDIVCFRIEFYPPKKQSFFPKYPNTNFDKNSNLWLKITNYSHWNMCNKAIKRDLINQVLNLLNSLPPIPRLNMAEDCLKTFLISIFLNNGTYINQILYHYCCDNSSSITKTNHIQQIQKSYQDYNFILSFVDKIPNLTPIIKYNKKILQKSIHIDTIAFLRKHADLLLYNIPLFWHLKSVKYDKSFKGIRHTIKILMLAIWIKSKHKINQIYH